LWDAQRAVRWVRFNASRYGINPDTIGVFGFSAGAMAALRPILPQILES
jgi:carboxylesterase type B